MNRHCLSIGSILACTIAARAAIVVETTPVVETFEAAPAPTEWATLAPTTAGDPVYTTAVALDTAVDTQPAAAISGTLAQSASNPPTANGTGWRYNSALQFLQSRPSGADFTLLKATLQNGSGANATGLSIRYDYSSASLLNPNAEQVPGIRVYYNLTGSAGSWVLIPELSIDTTAPIEAPENIGATVSFNGTWPAGSEMFLAFADDNGAGADPSYHIDNVSLVAIPEPSTGMLLITLAGMLGLSRRKRAT